MKRIRLDILLATAEREGPEYLQACLAAGVEVNGYLEMEDAEFAYVRATVRGPQCRACDQFWPDQEWCAAPECKCKDEMRFRPWLHLARCPVGKWPRRYP